LSRRSTQGDYRSARRPKEAGQQRLEWATQSLKLLRASESPRHDQFGLGLPYRLSQRLVYRYVLGAQILVSRLVQLRTSLSTLPWGSEGLVLIYIKVIDKH